MVPDSSYLLVSVFITMERSTIFNGQIHYKWAIFNSTLLNCQRVSIKKIMNWDISMWECSLKLVNPWMLTVADTSQSEPIRSVIKRMSNLSGFNYDIL